MVHFWDTAADVAQHTLCDRTDLVRALAVSLHGKKVVSASDDGIFQLWDTKTGEMLWNFKGNAIKIVAIAFS